MDHQTAIPSVDADATSASVSPSTSTDSGLRSQPTLASKLRVAYLNNPDPVYYNELDGRLQRHLADLGLEVIPFSLEDLSIKMTSENGVVFHLKGHLFEFDGLFNYGHMSAFHHQAFMLLLEAMQCAHKFCLHTVKNQKILDNKFLQSVRFSRDHVSIPDTFSGFSLPAYK